MTETSIFVVAQNVSVKWSIKNFNNARRNHYCYSSDPFPFVGFMWKLQMSPNLKDSKEVDIFFLPTSGTREHRKLQGALSLINIDGTKCCTQALIQEDDFVLCFHIDKSLIFDTEKVLHPPDGTLTLLCELKLLPADVASTEVQTTDDESFLPTKCPADGLCEELSELFRLQACLDVSLKTCEESVGAHRAVLAARSSVFAAMFSHDTIENRSGVVEITDADADTLKDMLDYAYTGEVKAMTSDKANRLYRVADKYAFHKLRAFCRDYLLVNMSMDDVCDIALLADDHSDSKMIESLSLFVSNNMSDVLRSSQWKALKEKNNSLALCILEAHLLTNTTKSLEQTKLD